MNNMNLSNKIDKIWQANNNDFEKRLSNWLDALNHGNESLCLVKNIFHRWTPLKAYVSVTRTKSPAKAFFSLRFFGQEIAILTVKNNKVSLRLKGHQVKNEKWFKLSLADGVYPWRGKEAQLLRTHFKELARSMKDMPKVRSPEHHIESKFLVEMCKGTWKFGLDSLRIQPVLIAKKFPLQMPLPISANTGSPVAGTGYIDILARHSRLKNNKSRLSVWELKKPGTYQHAASQAYIYSVVLLKVLRYSKRAIEWYKLFGINSPIPASLEIEAVVAIDRSKEKNYKKELTFLIKNSPLKIDNDFIRLYVAYYREKSGTIIFENDPFS
jgi:hypothetical protein